MVFDLCDYSILCQRTKLEWGCSVLASVFNPILGIWLIFFFFILRSKIYSDSGSLTLSIRIGAFELLFLTLKYFTLSIIASLKNFAYAN